MMFTERDRRDRRWANTLIDIADALIGTFPSPWSRRQYELIRALWLAANMVEDGLTLDDMIRRVYSPIFRAEIRRLASSTTPFKAMFARITRRKSSKNPDPRRKLTETPCYQFRRRRITLASLTKSRNSQWRA